MKIPLFLLLISLAVLTAAKHDFKFVREHKHRQTSTDVDRCTDNNSGTTKSGTTNNSGTKNTSGTKKYSGTKNNSGTKTTSGTNNNPSTTPQSSGWVQNPSGKASFTLYDGCQSACKLSTYFHPCSSEPR